ncbi:FtsX-like permease family protein [Flavobacteriaceae bacterium TP-CH-4]|uniref:FtsX-like permease family protein n=1 Tax=Pelagihabitans pacificus TaxID=2696054 RepID=A0A967AVH0_9FLAO|nr:ABC transporter permease [Pelagihabitans pacificus]NHF59920.1 FtsX-like permease family protein [Pelagihabitans pacificus]
MFKNHLKIAWRSLKKQPFFTFLNTFGLAIGMAGALLIALYIYDELSFDKMFADADRIYRIDSDIKFGGAEMKASEAAAPMAAAMQRDFSQVESTVRFRDRGSLLLRKSGTEANTKELRVTFADSTVFDFFGIDLLVGDAKTALTQPNTLVLTKTAAEKHFGIRNALGQNIILNNTDTYTVTGVIDDLPKNSFLRDHTVFMAMAGYPDSRSDNWGSSNYFTFVKLIPLANIDDFDELLQGMLERYMLPWAQEFFPGMTKESFEASGNYLRYHTMALTDIHLNSNRQSEMSANSSIQNVYILCFIGLFLIVLASVNFMNLSTAYSLKRAKEVGVRKTLGSNKRELIRQFLTESGLISFISLLFALLVTMAVLPFFNELAGKSISMPYTSPIFWVIMVVTTFGLGLFSGSYPAFFMSRFMPVKTLKGGGQSEVGGGRIRNGLVVFQFAISVFLIVSTMVVFQQLKYIQNKDLGFAKDQVLLINDTFAAGNQVKAFKEEVLKLAQVESATISSFLPTPSARSNSSYFKEGAMTQENAIQIQTWDVDHDYLGTLNMDLVAGRNFNREYTGDSTAVIINEATLPVLGVDAQEAIGMKISQDIELDRPQFYEVIGVVKNFHFESLREDIGALGLFLRSSTGNMAIKLKAGDFSNSIATIQALWGKLAPGQPFDYQFMDESFNTTYRSEQRLGEIFIVFTVLSILIACLGLFGLAAFNAQKRTKEIGIRKVLGASTEQITYRLTTDFLKLVGIAVLIALPLGWYAMNKWLEDFSYRIEIAWWVFVLAALLAVLISIVTVSYQSIKAAIVNPVKSLRTE